MIKSKWIDAALPNGFENTVKNLYLFPARSSGSESGFEIIDLSTHSCTAEYVFHEERIEPSLTTNGRQIEVVIKSIKRERFCLISTTDKRGYVVVQNPGRSLKKLLDFLHSATGGGVFYQPVRVPLEYFIKVLRKTYGRRAVSLKRVRANNIRISESASATIEISSSADAFKELRNTYPDGGAITKVWGTINTEDITTKFEASSSGFFVADEDLQDQLSSTIITSLTTSL